MVRLSPLSIVKHLQFYKPSHTVFIVIDIIYFSSLLHVGHRLT